MKTKKWNFRLGWGFLFALIFLYACTDDFEQPFNQRIPAGETGLIGLWEVVSVRKDFSKIVLDEFGNAMIDDKNRTIWTDTTLTLTAQQGYSEFIQFESSGGVETFMASASLEGIESGEPDALPNMPLLCGQWSVFRTINPEKEMGDVSSILLYNPDDMHNTMGSLVWTIQSQSATELSIQYSFGAASYDTLFTKSFHKR